MAGMMIRFKKICRNTSFRLGDEFEILKHLPSRLIGHLDWLVM